MVPVFRRDENAERLLIRAQKDWRRDTWNLVKVVVPIRGSPNGARYPRPQPSRDRPESVVAINRNAWSQSIGTAGRDHPVPAGESSKWQL